jgi:hypothetical protein
LKRTVEKNAYQIADGKKETDYEQNGFVDDSGEE